MLPVGSPLLSSLIKREEGSWGDKRPAVIKRESTDSFFSFLSVERILF